MKFSKIKTVIGTLMGAFLFGTTPASAEISELYIFNKYAGNAWIGGVVVTLTEDGMIVDLRMNSPICDFGSDLSGPIMVTYLPPAGEAFTVSAYPQSGQSGWFTSHYHRQVIPFSGTVEVTDHTICVPSV